MKRERTGEGARVDASMMGATVNIMENPVARHAFTGQVPEPEGLSHPVVSPFSGYKHQGRPLVRRHIEHEPLPRIRRGP